VHPGLPDWEVTLDAAVARGVPAVRCDPTFYGLAPAGAEMLELVAACGERAVPLMMAVRLEDGRQRHPNDRVTDLPPSAVRQMIRSHPSARLIITHADRDFVEQVHFGSTPDEARRLLWDICWMWGPPEDHLELLLETIGAERFAFGTGLPLRLPETSIAKIDLLNLDASTREMVMAGNVAGFVSS
jgi:predicted TIM-barrel fold metal-dependent hydrolase